MNKFLFMTFIFSTFIMSCDKSVLDKPFNPILYKTAFTQFFKDENISNKDAFLINYSIIRQREYLGYEIENKSYGEILEMARVFNQNGIPVKETYDETEYEDDLEVTVSNIKSTFLNKSENSTSKVKNLKFKVTYKNISKNDVALNLTTFIINGPFKQHLITAGYETNCKILANKEMVVNYVINSAEPLLLNNAQSDDHYSNDHHVVKQQIKSVLCCPILLFGKLFGVIYLENNVSTRAFTEDRLHVLKLLSSQMAISIQNAFLYAHLEEQVEERTLQLSKEKEKSDNLLHNILPEQIANELKIKGESKARLFESVSVIFTDFADFTKIGSNFSPNELVSQLDHFFSQFDEINRRFGIEKIKTIGDSYMAASGLPEPSEDFNKRAVLAALEMQKFIENHYSEHVKAGKPAFKMRVGIHTGPVIAGIVGIKKFQYDIWGDTVNTASRMESSGEIGKVNISQATYELLKNDSQFVFENRGKIKAKGKGEMEMWFVSAKAEQ